MNKKTIILKLLIPFFLVGCSGKNPGSTSTSKTESSSIASSEVTSSSTSEIKTSSSNVTPSSSSIVPSSSSQTPSSSSSTQSYVAVTSVSLNESSMEISTDDSVLLIATVLPENATNKNMTWSSSKLSVATVNNGQIIPVGVGTTVITVETTDGHKTAQCTVVVKEPSVTFPNYVLHGCYNGDDEWTDKPMFNNPASTTEYMIQGVTLFANDIFKVHMYGDTWYGYSAIKSSVKSGLVTAAPSDDNIKVLTTGVYDIYCDYNESDSGHIYLAKVDGTSSTVNVSGISLSNTGKYLLTRNEFTITPTVYPNNATNKEIRWTSSDETIATVSNGRVVAKEKKGSTTITAKTVDGNFTATCIVYVSPSQYPDYCLTGTVGGRSYTYLNTKYAAIPLSTGKYLIPDVDLVAGDELTVMNNQGSRLMNKYNQVYKKEVRENMSVNVYLNVNDSNKDYLSFAPKNNDSN